MRLVHVLIAAILTVAAPLTVAQEAGPYKVLMTTRVGGEGGWERVAVGDGFDVHGSMIYVYIR